MTNNEVQANTGPAQDLARSINNLVESFASWANQVGQQIVPAINQMYNAIYEQYLQAGAPYGESSEGCLRWVTELSQVRRYEQEIERIISHHEGLAYLRKRLAEKQDTEERRSDRNAN